MPSPTETPPASPAPLLAASIDARAAAGDHREARARRARGRSASACGVRRVVGAGAGGAEDRDRRTELGERAEALDELALDPQHPPRVGVHPVAGAAGVEQPLVGGAGLDLRRAASRVAAAELLGTWPSSDAGHEPASSQARSCRSTVVICSSGTNSSCLCASMRVAGAEVHGRDAERAEPGDVGPAELRVRRAADRRRRTPPRPARTGRAAPPGAASVTSIVEAVEDLAHVGVGLVRGPVGREAVVDRDRARVGEHVAGDAAGDRRPR